MKSDASLHLAIIPDGNRRWAKLRSLHPWKGHETAIENFRTITDFCRDNPRISVLTVWCFSTENWKRDTREVAELMRIYEEYLRGERASFLEKQTRFLHSGRLDRIPATLAALIRDIEEETKNQTEFTLHLAIDYGGKDEITRALSKILRQKPTEGTKEVSEVSEASEKLIRSALDQPSLQDIDLVLRTSGEHRTSNFFLWQTPYAEWIFLEKFFPDLKTEDIAEALEEFDRRKRRYGK